MKNEELCYRALRKKTEHELASMPLEQRVDHLVKKHRRSIMLAKKHGVNVYTIEKEHERGGAK